MAKKTKKYIYTGTKGWALPRKVMALAEPIEPGEETHMTVGVPYGKTHVITICLTRKSRDRNKAWVFTKKEWDQMDEGDIERLMERMPTYEGAEIMPMKKELAAEMRKARLEEEAAAQTGQGVARPDAQGVQGEDEDPDESYSYEVDREGQEDDGELFSAVIEPRKRGGKLGSANPNAGRPAGSKNKRDHKAGGARRNSGGAREGAGRKRKKVYEGEEYVLYTMYPTTSVVAHAKELRAMGVDLTYAFELWLEDYYRRVKGCDSPEERPEF